MIEKSNKKLSIINTIISLLQQAVVMIYGLIVPRLVLSSFGSEINGLVSSVSQFLGLVTILEGGVGGVIKASLYKPLAEHDSKKLSAVYNASVKFYRKLAIIYATYGLLLAFTYPIIFDVNYSWNFTFSLIFIIATQTFIQYFFSVNLKNLIVADRRGYVVSIVSILMHIFTLIITIFILHYIPNVLILKGAGVIAFAIQPIIYGTYVKKHYSLDKKIPEEKETLSQRWDGFGQNLAYFIHTNTDTVVLTIFGTLLDVSVYSVYFMIVSSLYSLVASVSSSISPSMGNVLSKGNILDKNRAFDIYNFVQNNVTTFCFSCGIILITPFVMIYTNNITDTSYFHPYLGYFLMLAEAAYCYRDSYINVAYNSGHFKQTAKYAYIEAGLNIILSIIFVLIWGIEGVALATFIAMTFRLIAHIIYLKKNILFRPITKSIYSYICAFMVIIGSFIITRFINFQVNTYLDWIIFAFVTATIVLLLQLLSILVFDKDQLKKFIYALHKK